MEFGGRDIFDIRVPRSQVSYSDLFEWREAAHWTGCQWRHFCRLDGDEQAAIVAHYRAHLQLEAVLAQDQERRRGQA